MEKKQERKYYNSLNIYTPPGRKVRFMNANGHDGEKEEACLYLQEGAVYTLLKADIYRYRTEIYLEEFPEIPFNSVMFANVKEGE